MTETKAAVTVFDFLSPVAFELPDWRPDGAWTEHGPFAAWLVQALRPSLVVELGSAGGYSLAAFCRAIKAGGMDTFFASRGIAADQAKTCLADTAKATKLVEASNKAGQELDIRGTPTFFLNGAKLETNTWEGVKVMLEKAGAR